VLEGYSSIVVELDVDFLHIFSAKKENQFRKHFQSTLTEFILEFINF
jgi:hypothetical protein